MFVPVVQDELPKVSNSGDVNHHFILPFSCLGQSLTYRIVPQCIGNRPNLRKGGGATCQSGRG
jgi:hypothetical protein